MREDETTVQLCEKIGAVFLQLWYLRFHNHIVFGLSYSPLLQSQDSLHHNMVCIIYPSEFIYIHMGNLLEDGTRV